MNSSYSNPMSYVSKNAAILTLITFISGCATGRDSVLLGAGVGAAGGGFIGNQASEHTLQGTAIGAAVGAVTGGLLGYLAHGDKEKKEKAKEDVKLKDDLLNGSDYPFLTKPKVKVIIVPNTLEDGGRRFVEKHRIFLIDEQSSFSK